MAYRRRLIITLATIALPCVLLWSGAVGYMWLNESRFVFRSEFSHRAGRILDSSLTSLRLRTTDGIELEAVTLSANESAPVRYWVVFFQGNAGFLQRPRVQRHLHVLHGLGYNVLSFDYRGYGRSGGVPSEAGLYEDGFAAYNYVIGLGVPTSRIILAGQSLGSAVAVELATRVGSAGAVLFSPIDSVPLTASRVYPWVPAHLLARNRFDSNAKIDRIRTPILVFHSAADRLIPLTAAQALYDRIRGPKLLVETEGGHNGAGFADLEVLREAMWRFWPAAFSNGNEAVASGS
jgi:hypothetical protein